MTTVSPVDAQSRPASHAVAGPAAAQRACESCHREWFGPVAYCPYCGRMPGSANGAGGDRPTIPPEMKAAPPRPAAISGETSPPGTAAPSPMHRRSIELLATLLVAAVTALLLWIVIGPSASGPGKAVPPRMAARPDDAAGGAPSKESAQVRPIARPAHPAVPAVPAPAEKRVLCSAAHEAAGLCKSHE